MAFRTNVPSASRGLFFSTGGDDLNDGLSSERPKFTPQDALDAAASLVPTPSLLAPALVSCPDGGFFSGLSVVMPDAVSFFAGETRFLHQNPGVPFFQASDFCIVEILSVDIFIFPEVAATVFEIDANLEVSISVQRLSPSSQDTIGFNLVGVCDDVFLSCLRIRLEGLGAIGVNVTDTFTTPSDLIVNVEAVNLDNSNTIFVKHNPLSAADKTVVSVSSVKSGSATTGTIGFEVLSGILVVEQDGVLEVDTACHVASGATLHLDCGDCRGDVVVDPGGLLIVRVESHTGTITNNGTIVGNVGTEFFGAHTIELDDLVFRNDAGAVLNNDLSLVRTMRS